MPHSKSGRPLEDDSAFEVCGFACHVLLVLLSSLYLIWVFSPSITCDSAELQEGCAWSFIPDPVWTIVVPTALLSVFVAAPLIYGALNGLSAAPVDSIESLRDDYSVLPRKEMKRGLRDESSVPAICDLDVADINDLAFESLRK